MATAQINARIDADVKAAGDAAFAYAGYTPTQAIRALWEFGARNLHDPKKLRSFLDQLENDRSPGTTMEDIVKEVEEGPLIYERALREMGIYTMEPCDTPYEELLEQALAEKMIERGTWA